jgi:hypothetical protein
MKQQKQESGEHSLFCCKICTKILHIIADGCRKGSNFVRNCSLSRKQSRFLRALLVGKKIVDASKDAGISERCAYYWLKDPVFVAERTRCEAELSRIEMEEITRLSLADIERSFYDRKKR